MNPVDRLQTLLEQHLPNLSWRCRAHEASAVDLSVQRIEILARRPSSAEADYRFALSGAMLARWGAEAIARQICLGFVWRRIAEPEAETKGLSSEGPRQKLRSTIPGARRTTSSIEVNDYRCPDRAARSGLDSDERHSKNQTKPDQGFR